MTGPVELSKSPLYGDRQGWLKLRREGLAEWRALSPFARLVVIEYELTWPHRIQPEALCYRVGLNPRSPSDMKFCEAVMAELARAKWGREQGLDGGDPNGGAAA